MFRQAREADFLSMIADCGDDLQRQSQGTTSVFERNYRSRTLAHGVKEGFQLGMEGLFGGDRRLTYANLRID